MIAVDDLSVRAGQFWLRGVGFKVPQGGYGVLMGRTGSGKTTLLEAITGLIPIHQGRVLISGREVTRLKPAERNIGYVPQDGALFPTMTVGENIGFALSVRRRPWPDIERRVKELAQLLEIGGLLDRSVRKLSGGEKQRVALGRALAFRPGTLCLDEPLSALDEATRDQIAALLKRVQRETGVTVLHVTHSRADAEQLADVVLTLVDGSVLETTEAVGKPARRQAEQQPAE